MSDNKQSADELIGQTIAGRYRIISRLGAGGMGVAYRAWDEGDGVPVVIKIPKKAFLDDPTFAERFAREIRLLQGLRHPHIVPIVDVGEHEGLPYVAMRFLPGGSLSNRRLRDDDGKPRPNPPGVLHLWLPAVAGALDHVHANGVVHRDVKPANIFFDAYWNAFLGDFGIAKIVEESESFDREHTLTATNMGIGTQEYMGPEQFSPKPLLDGRTDQYALAVMAYEMVAGSRPFTGTTAHLIVEVTTLPVPRLDRVVRGLPPSLVEAVHRGLAKNPGERFSTCREFAYEVLRDVSLLADEPDIARLLCPKCSNILKLPVSAAGQKGKCPKCQTQMKVADDLGALWLLDEARRQRRAAASIVDVEDIEGDQEPAETESGVDEQALEAFKPVSSTTPIERAARKQARKASTGMILGGVAAAVVALAGLWMILPKPAQQFTYEQKLTQAQEKVRRNPNDTDANDFLGRHWCFRKGDWKKGLPYLAKSGAIGLWNTAKKQLELESANPATGAGDMVQFAKEWWTLAAQKQFVSADEAQTIKKHAVGIYTAAVDGLTDAKDIEDTNRWLERNSEFLAMAGGKRPPKPTAPLVVQAEVPPEAITTTASSVYEPQQSVRHVVDGSGMSGDRHDNHGGAFTMWHTSLNPGASSPFAGVTESPAWVRFDFTTPQPVSRVDIWNHNQANFTDRGFRKARLWTSVDGASWTSQSIEIPRAEGAGDQPRSLVAQVAGAPVKSVVLAAESNYGGNCYGLSEVKFFCRREAAPLGNGQATKIKSQLSVSDILEESVISGVAHKQFRGGRLREAFNDQFGAWIDLVMTTDTLQESVIPGRGHIQYQNGKLREAWGDQYGAWIDLSVTNDTLQESVIPGCGHIQYRNGKLREAWGEQYGALITIREPVEQGQGEAPKPRWPSDAMVWEKNSHAYKVFKERLRWPQAKRRCEELGGHLVSITSQEERQFVHAVISAAGIPVDNLPGREMWQEKLWAGGTDEGSEGKWRWVDGSPWKFAPWLPQQPDNDGNYLNICPHRGGGWNDENAVGPLVSGFICEWPKQPVSSAPPVAESQHVSVWLADLPIASRQSHFFHSRMSWERIGGKWYANTIHIHPEVSSGQSQLVYQVDGKYDEIVGAIGILDLAQRVASPQIFRIVGDGKDLWKSAPFKQTGKGEDFRVNVSGVKTLELHTDSTGSRFDAHCVWIEPRLVSGGSKENPKTADDSTQTRDAPSLQIIQARFGIGNSWKDVTSLLQRKVKRNELVVSCSHHEFGDPAPSVLKSLEVTFRFGDGPSRNCSISEGAAILIHADHSRPRRPFQLLQALYGAGTQWVDISRNVKPYLKADGLRVENYGNTNQWVGGDPAPGIVKNIVIVYEADGRQKFAVFGEGAKISVP